LVNPPPQRLDLLRGQRAVRVGRRHDLVGVLAADAADDLALRGPAGNDHGPAPLLAEGALPGVQTQGGPARAGVGAVAMEAVVGQDGQDVAGKLDTVGGTHGSRQRRESCQADEDRATAPCERETIHGVSRGGRSAGTVVSWEEAKGLWCMRPAPQPATVERVDTLIPAPSSYLLGGSRSNRTPGAASHD